MRMLKIRKKSISLLVVLTFLMTLFPLALPALAATEYEALSVPTVSDGSDDENLGDILITVDNLGPGLHQAEISLPSGFDVTGASLSDYTYSEVWYDGNSVVVEIDNDSLGVLEGFEVVLDISADIPDGAEGDIVAEIDNVTGQLYGGDVTIGKVADGEVTVKVTDEANLSEDGGWVTFRVTETADGTVNDDDTIELLLPDGFEWDDAYLYDTAFGDDSVTAQCYIDEDELSIEFSGETDIRTAFVFDAYIDVDFDEAEYGDVIADVKGDYDATPEEVTVGNYGDYGATITAEDPDTIAYAGRFEQEVSNITIEEESVGSLVYGRYINLELPDNARWTKFADEEIDGDTGYFELDSEEDEVVLAYWGLAGSDDNILRLKVVEGSVDEADTIEIEDIEVALEAAVVGDLVVTVTSSAGVTEDDITIAEVVNPVTVTAEKENVIIGKNDQAAGNITITEYDAEAIMEVEDGWIVVAIDEDIEFAEDPEVEVTVGDLKIGDVEVDYNGLGDHVLGIEIDRESNDASTIVISGILYDVNRTVAEGNLGAEVGGSALVETDGFEYPDSDEIWEDSDIVAEFVSAICITPAPGEKQIKAVFTLGSTSFTLNDVAQTMDVAPYAKDGRTYLPMRYVAKALGIADSSILWKNGTATFISGDKVVSVTIGSQIMYINGAAVPIDAAPEIVNGRTMLPIRWIATAFGVDVAWDAATQQVTVE